MSVIQDIIKNEGDPDSWPVDVHEYTRQQTLFWESYLSFSNIHLLSNCRYPESGLARTLHHHHQIGPGPGPRPTQVLLTVARHRN